MNNSGIVFSIDAMTAGIVVFVFTGIIFLAFSSAVNYSFNEINQSQFAMDSLTVLEKNSSLKNAVELNSVIELRRYINQIPANYCMGIKLIDSQNNVFSSVSTENCSEGKTISSASRTFVVSNGNNFNFYSAQARLWVKQ